jgi:hypothetical protein
MMRSHFNNSVSDSRFILRRIKQLIAFLLFAGLSLSVYADNADIVIISSQQRSLEPLTKEEVAEIFLGRSSSASQWHPIDSKDEVLRDKFYRAVAGISANRARAQWARLVFSARISPPLELPTEEIAASIASDSSKITYVFKNRIPKNAQVLLELR